MRKKKINWKWQRIIAKRKDAKYPNREFAMKDKKFIQACANIPWKDKDGKPTTLPSTSRQASKWRNNKGLAWNKGKIT